MRKTIIFDEYRKGSVIPHFVSYGLLTNIQTNSCRIKRKEYSKDNMYLVRQLLAQQNLNMLVLCHTQIACILISDTYILILAEMEQEIMEQEIEKDFEIFIPTGFHICWVKEAKHEGISIKRAYLPYKGDETTVRELIDKLGKSQGINLLLKAQSKEISFRLKNIGRIPPSTSIHQIKDKLHNYQVEIEFIPQIIPIVQFQYQCADCQSYNQHSEYKDVKDPSNMIELCVEMPQLSYAFYESFNRSNTVCREVKIALSKKSAELGSNFSEQQCLIFCNEEKVNSSNTVGQIVRNKHHLTLTFPKRKDKIVEPVYSHVKIKIVRGLGETLKVFTYSSVKHKKIRTILEQANIEDEGLSLKIFNRVLKPNQFIEEIQSSIAVLNEMTISAHLIEESALFYSCRKFFEAHSISLEELKEQNKIKQNLLEMVYKRRKDRCSQIQTPMYQAEKFIDPIIGYTCNAFYLELNLKLRKSIFATVEEANYLCWEYKFSFSLIDSLLKLPNYGGLIYRGVDYCADDIEQGSIYCFKAFTSTSKDPTTAQKFGKATLFIIHCLTGKDITQFSYYGKEQEILLLPYTYFEVTAKEEKHGQVILTMHEIPTPRKDNCNLLIWVDDKTTEGLKLFQDMQKNYPYLQTEVIQLVSNHQLSRWIEKFNCFLLNSRIRVSAITDMCRETETDGVKRVETDAGVGTINLLRKINEKMSIFVYVGNAQETQKLVRNKLKETENVRVGDRKSNVLQFIKEKVVDPLELVKINSSQDNCQLI